MKLGLRQCTIYDLDDLIKISKETFEAKFGESTNPDDFKAYMEFAFSNQKIRSELENKDSQFHFVFDKEELMAYFKLNKGETQTDVKDKNAMELQRIYVLTKHQGKGIGKWMLKHIVQITRKEALDYIWLGVWENNKAAIRFYKKHGFKKFGSHPYYIGTDKQTDWLMRLDLQ